MMNMVLCMFIIVLFVNSLFGVFLDGLGEQVWIEVIQKMDEVYNDLLQYEVVFEEKNVVFEELYQFIESVLVLMFDILIVCDCNGNIEEVNILFCYFVGQEVVVLEQMFVFNFFVDDIECVKVCEVFVCFGWEGVYDCEFFLCVGDGLIVLVLMNCMLWVLQIGKLMGMVVIGWLVGELCCVYQVLCQVYDDLKCM